MEEEKLIPNWERFSNFEIGSSGAVDTSDIKVVAFIGWNKNMGCVRADGMTYANAEREPSSGQITVTKGNSVFMEAVPKAGYHFVCWHGGPVDGSTQRQVTVTLTAPCAINAVFAADSVDAGEAPVDNNGPISGNMNSETTVVYTNADTFNLKAFVMKWWWAILIVAYIAYKEWKGARQ